MLSAQSHKTITINDNELGFLRVRESASTSSKEIAQVKPGESYPVLNETTSGNKTWYQITTPEGITGWVSGNYVSVEDKQ